MVLLWAVLLCVIASLVAFLLWRDTVRPEGFPPGPPWLPWFGNAFLVQRLSKKYGGQHGVFEYLSRRYRSPVVGYRQGRELTVAVTDYTLAREILTNDDLLSRPDNLFVGLRTFGSGMGLSFTDGKLWKEHRIFITTKLKQMGHGRQRMEELIQTELISLIELIQSNPGPHSPSNLLDTHVINVIWTTIAGAPIEQQSLLRLLDILKKLIARFDTSGGLLTRMPWLRFLAPEASGYTVLTDLHRQLKTFFLETVEQHRANFSEDRASDDLIYAYLQEIATRQTDPDSTFTVEQTAAVIFDLFIATSQNISSYLQVLLLQMIIRPDIQAKIHAEIDQYPPNWEPSWATRHLYPYTQAVIQETQRLYHVFALAGPRRTLKDVAVGEFRIPANTTVFVDLRSIHMDREYWSDPEVFRPERFLDAGGDQLVTFERFMPFSIGKRRCPGDLASRACLFSFFAGLLKAFQVCAPDDEDVPRMVELVPGMTYAPKPYKIVFKAKHVQH